MNDNTPTPAFPSFEFHKGFAQMMPVGGMTLRDYFAAKALQGMSANPEDVHDADQETYDEYVEEISRCAYKIADAMMKAREA
jgi:hypothetical protein